MRLKGLRWMSLCALALIVVTTASPRVAAQWQDVGNSMAGTSPLPPALAGFGPLLPTAGTKITLSGGLPFGSGTLVVGLSNLGVAFKGGIIVPHPDFFLPMSLDGSGFWQIIFSWPTDIPAGFLLWWQAWLPDAGGPKGFAASNGLQSTAN